MTEDYRLLVTGSRRIQNGGRMLLRDRLRSCLDHVVREGKRLVVVEGECPTGADREAVAWVREVQWLGQPVIREGHPAQDHPTQDFGPWPGAGPRRNSYMVSLGADYCLALIYACNSIWCKRPDPHGSHGATDCVTKAEAKNIPTDRQDLWKAV